MTDKTKVKVIKKGSIKPAKIEKPRIKSKRAQARDMVSTVTNWVTDLQVRKSGETKAAIEKLFAVNPQPSEL